MKKAFWCFFLLAVLSGVVLAASVEVANPANGVFWVKGQTYAITWIKTGSMPGTVRISLRNAATLAEVALIQDNVPNTGSYQWAIPASTTDGPYKVRVKVKDAAIQDDSDQFNIGTLPPPPPPQPFITVTKPVAGETWKKNTAYTITWSKNGTMPDLVKIDLVDKNGSDVVKPIADNKPNSGSYLWTVPADSTSADYRVRVQVKTTAIKDDSDVFHIGLLITPGNVGTSAALAVKTYTIPAINILNWTCLGGSPVYGIPKCSVWQNVMPIFQARPGCYSQASGSAEVGADHFTYIWDNAPITAFIAYRARLGFDVSDFMGKGANITEAKLHLTQMASVRSNTSDASCGVSWWFLTANPVQTPQGWQDVPIDPSCHGSLVWTQTDYTVDVSCAIQRWVNGSHPNFGIILISRWEDYTSETWTCLSCFKAELVLKVKGN